MFFFLDYLLLRTNVVTRVARDTRSEPEDMAILVILNPLSSIVD